MDTFLKFWDQNKQKLKKEHNQSCEIQGSNEYFKSLDQNKHFESIVMKINKKKN